MNTPVSKSRRWIIWALLPTLAITVLALFDEPASEADGSSGKHRSLRTPPSAERPPNPVERAAKASATPSPQQLVEQLELPPVIKAGQPHTSDPAVPAAEPIDLLAARSWYIPPPPPSPVAPKAPPLPFKVLGRIIDDADPVVFLGNQDRNLVAREGTKLDNNYLVERIENKQMVFVYLPLKERQTLSLGAVN